ncbi:MAG TPA: hypothetical protein VNF75_06605 [Candidatus Dormibacteraeota bacterium]|nr:hypothetical protein [Candidatus Dormibacteraeota bacterium]
MRNRHSSGGSIEEYLGLGDTIRQVQDTFGLTTEALVELVEEAVREAWMAAEGTVPDVTVSLEAETGRLVFGVLGPGHAAASEARLVELTDGGSTEPGPPIQLSLAELPTAIAAQASRRVKVRLSRWIRERREERLTGNAEEHRGQLVDTIVERAEGGIWYLRAGELQAFLEPAEQIPTERLQRGQHLKVVLLEARRSTKGEYLEVRASRTSPLLLRRLLESEVPELGEGSLVLRSVTREPGERAKVAVESLRSEIDAKGACIGLKGVRIRAVVGQLAGEKVDVLEWSASPAEYVSRALAPAPIISVKVDEEARRATVTVDPAVLSLAIGREGQNARLAARLTGWRIDIHPADGPAYGSDAL